MAGIQPAQFWRMTPWELSVVFAAENERRESVHAEHAWLAWHCAYLPWTKKPVDLKKLMGVKVERNDVGASLHNHLITVNEALKRKGEKDV